MKPKEKLFESAMQLIIIHTSSFVFQRLHGLNLLLHPSQMRKTLSSSLMQSLQAVTQNPVENHMWTTGMQMWTS